MSPVLVLAALLIVITATGVLTGLAAAADKNILFARTFARASDWSKNNPGRRSAMLNSRFGSYLMEFPAVILFGMLLIVALWALFGLLEDVVMGDGIVGLDRLVYQGLQSLRHPVFDRLLVGITQLGDARTAMPVTAMALFLFLILRRWREALVFTLAMIGAAAFVSGLKRVIQRARPMDIYDGVAEYSFPSGHAGMGIVLFGMLAFLLAARAAPAWRRAIYGISIPFVLLICFSRLYLGAHWLSDVLAGVAFGLAWNSALAMVYLRQVPLEMPTRMMILVLVATFILAGSLHMARDYQRELQRYSGAPFLNQRASP